MKNNLKLFLKICIPYNIFIVLAFTIIFIVLSNSYKKDYIEEISIQINKIRSIVEEDINNINLVLNMMESYTLSDVSPY